MATQSATLEATPSRPSMVSVGTVVWLSSELMFFAALFAIYFTLKAASLTPWPPVGGVAGKGPVALDVLQSGVATLVLLSSSFTCQFGVWAAERGDVYGMRRWYTLTFVLGATFMGNQFYEYFVTNTFSISSHAYGSAYYLTTGFHGLHVIGGLVAFLVVLGRSSIGSYTPENAISAVVVSYYWHFVDVVWIGLYSTIFLLQ